jgi:hypothetical protein
MAVKPYAEVTIKSKFYIPQDRTPEMNIEVIMQGIKGLGGKGVAIVGNRLVTEIPQEEPKR